MPQIIETTGVRVALIHDLDDVKLLLNQSLTTFPKGFASAKWDDVELLFFDVSDCCQAIIRAFVIVSTKQHEKFPHSVILFQLIALEISAQAFDAILANFPYLRQDMMSCTVDPLTYFDYAVAQHQILSKLASGARVPLGGSSKLPQALVFASQTFLEYVLSHSYCGDNWKTQPALRVYGKALVATLVKYQEITPLHCKVISIDYMDKLMQLPALFFAKFSRDECSSFVQIDGVDRSEGMIHCRFPYTLSLLTTSGETLLFQASKLYDNGHVVLIDDGRERRIALNAIAAFDAKTLIVSVQDYSFREMKVVSRCLFTFGNLVSVYFPRGQRHLNVLLIAEAEPAFIKFFVQHGMRLSASSIQFFPHHKHYLNLLKWYASRKSRSYVDFPELVAALLANKMYKSVRSVLSAGDLQIRYFTDILRNQLNDVRLSVFTQSADHVVANVDFSQDSNISSALMAYSHFNADHTIFPPYLNTLVLSQPDFVRVYLDALYQQQPAVFAQDMRDSLAWILKAEATLLPLLTCVLHQSQDKDLCLAITEDQKNRLIQLYPLSNPLKQLLGCDTDMLAAVAYTQPMTVLPLLFTPRCATVITKLTTLQKNLFALVDASREDFHRVVSSHEKITPRDRAYFLKLAESIAREIDKFQAILKHVTADCANAIRFGEIRVDKFQAQLAYCRNLLANACVHTDAKAVVSAPERKAGSVSERKTPRVGRPIHSVMHKAVVHDSKPGHAVRYKPVWTTVIRAFSDEYQQLSDEHKHLGLVRFMNAVQKLNYLFEHESDACYMRNSYVQTNLARNFVSHRLLCLSEDQRQTVLAQYEALLDYADLSAEGNYDPKSQVVRIITMLNDIESSFPKSPTVVKSLYHDLLKYLLAKYQIKQWDMIEQVALLVDIGVCVTELYNSTDSYPIEAGLGSRLQGLRNIVVHEVLSDIDLAALKQLQTADIKTNLICMSSDIQRLVSVIEARPSFAQLIVDSHLSDTKLKTSTVQMSADPVDPVVEMPGDDDAHSATVLAMK